MADAPARLRDRRDVGIIDVQHHSGKSSKKKVESWLREVCEQTAVTPHEVAGVGQHYAARGASVAGGITVHQGQMVHAAVFAIDSER